MASCRSGYHLIGWCGRTGKELKAIREIQDETLPAGGREWTEAWLAEEIVMRSPRLDDPPTFPRRVMVVQLFNHQTHHRSLVTGACHAMGIDYVATDIPWDKIFQQIARRAINVRYRWRALKTVHHGPSQNTGDRALVELQSHFMLL